MHITLPALLAAALLLPAGSTVQEEAPIDLATQYANLAADQDLDGLVALWRANEERVLGTIDRDLEGSLSLWESTQGETGEEKPVPEDAQAAIADLHARALLGARAASLAFDRPIFLDYAASFVSWNTAQKRAFRAGQAAFGASMEAFGEGAVETARNSAEACTELALPLGDWWGTAMGLGASGSAKLALGDHEAALADLSRARLLNHQLGLGNAETRNLGQMLTCLEELEAWPRALAVCDSLIAMLGKDGAEMYAEHRARIVEAL
jgi:hypothetical protein